MGPAPGLGESEVIIPGLGGAEAAAPGSVAKMLGPGGSEAASRVNTEPNLTCWRTGNLQRTSALYILTRPV